jgi:hypothetical protein
MIISLFCIYGCIVWLIIGFYIMDKRIKFLSERINRLHRAYFEKWVKIMDDDEFIKDINKNGIV